MKLISLSKGRAFAEVDDEDFDWLKDVGPWQEIGGYARRYERVDGKRIVIFMHRAIIQAPAGLTVDHIDRNGLNNRKTNLRLATQQENNWNATRRAVGGHPHWQTGKYRSQICHRGKKLDVGFFATPEEAKVAYAFVAYHLRGEFGTYEKPENFDIHRLAPSMRRRIASITGEGIY